MVQLWLLGRTEQTVKSYARDARRFLEFIHPKSLPDLSVKDVGDWAESLQGKLNYRIRQLSNVKSLLTFAHETGWCVFNVGAVIRLPRAKRKTQERISELRVVRGMVDRASEGRDRTLIRLMYTSGCRVSEAVAVNFIDLKIKRIRGPGGKMVEHGTVCFFGKGRKTRVVGVHPDVIREMQALRGASDGDESPVFKNFVNGKRLSVRAVQRIVAQARIADTRVVVTPHVFRHTHAVDALENGAKVEQVQAQLGHESLTTTSYYVKIRGDQGTAAYITPP
jgi:integrase/recombinase XerD